MEEESTKSNSKQTLILSIVGIVILFVAVIGISFAAFSYSQTGSKENTLTTGVIKMSYNNPTNGINLTNALPTTDTTGKALTGTNNVFDFTVTATITGTATINWGITATTTPGTSLTDSYVKVYLTDRGSSGSSDTQILAPTLVSSLAKTTSGNAYGAPTGQFILDTGTYTATTTDNYRLRMWVADTYTGTSSSNTYKLKVNVYGKANAR